MYAMTQRPLLRLHLTALIVSPGGAHLDRQVSWLYVAPTGNGDVTPANKRTRASILEPD